MKWLYPIHHTTFTESHTCHRSLEKMLYWIFNYYRTNFDVAHCINFLLLSIIIINLFDQLVFFFFSGKKNAHPNKLLNKPQISNDDNWDVPLKSIVKKKRIPTTEKIKNNWNYLPSYIKTRTERRRVFPDFDQNYKSIRVFKDVDTYLRNKSLRLCLEARKTTTLIISFLKV